MILNPWKRNRQLEREIMFLHDQIDFLQEENDYLNDESHIDALHEEIDGLMKTNETLSQAIMEREERITAQYRVQLQNLEDEIDGLKALLDQAAIQLRDYVKLRECVHDIALSCSNSTSGTALRVSRQMMEAIQ